MAISITAINCPYPLIEGTNRYNIHRCGAKFDLKITSDHWWDEGDFPGGINSNH